MATEAEVVEALREVEDPELGMDIVELGLFYGAEVEGPKVKVHYTLTSMGCPAGPTTPSSSLVSGSAGAVGGLARRCAAGRLDLGGENLELSFGPGDHPAQVLGHLGVEHVPCRVQRGQCFPAAGQENDQHAARLDERDDVVGHFNGVMHRGGKRQTCGHVRMRSKSRRPCDSAGSRLASTR